MRFTRSRKALRASAALVVVGAFAYFTTSGLSLPLSARGLAGFFEDSVLLLVSAALVQASGAGVGGRGHAGLRAWRVCGSALVAGSASMARGLVGLHA
jgi:hypothetical protein